MKKKCLIVSGGTAGHVLPSKEIAQSLRQLGYDIHWLGHGEPIEKISGEKSISYHQVLTRSPNRKVFFNLAYWKLFFHDLKVLRKLFQTYDFDFVLLTGNFITLLPGFFARLYKKPIYLYEQNAQLGRANLLLKSWAKKIFWGIHPPKPLKNNEYYTKQPLRKSLFQLQQNSQRYFARQGDHYTLLIIGGSLGAHFFNSKLIEILASSFKHCKKNWKIIHLSGKNGRVLHVQDCYEKNNLQALVLGYVDEMSSLYKKADAVVARAGALSLSELLFLKKPSLIIPMPNSVSNHQKQNAYSMSNHENFYYYEQDNLEENQVTNFLRRVESDIVELPQDKIAQLCLQS